MCQLQLIEEHTQRILRADPLMPYQQVCKACRSASFVRHDVRRREFYWRDELGCSRSCTSWIARWKCLTCKGIFTDYPPFALPEKRYTKESVFDAVQSFCEDDKATYRSPSSGRQASENGVQISSSTLWRWISWMKSRWWIPIWIIDQFLSWYPNSMIHRHWWLVAPSKARTNERLEVVSHARKFVRLVRMFELEKWDRDSPTLQHVASPLDRYNGKVKARSFISTN